MNRKIKLIWNFTGNDSLETAKHHCIHLKEFVQIKDLHFYEINYAEINEMLVIAFIAIDEKDMKIYRDTLKPHRATLYQKE